MTRVIEPGKRSGTVDVPSSKSVAHRMLICAALSENKSRLYLTGRSKDIIATVRCLNSMGAEITEDESKKAFIINPVSGNDKGTRELYCGESGSTLRFLLPVAGALGMDVCFHMEGKLPTRPLGALIDVLTANGMKIEQRNELLHCSGRLNAGSFTIPGDVSSQYISGLLFALPLLEGDSRLRITGKIESADYILMTEKAISDAEIHFEKTSDEYFIPGKQKYLSPLSACVESDWSNAAFFLCMGAMSEKGIEARGLQLDSMQGDKEILRILEKFGAEVKIKQNSVFVKKNRLFEQTIDASSIPDLVPTLCALAAGAEGTTRIVNASRLRYKESDRIRTTCEMLRSLGADIEENADGLTVHGKTWLSGGMIPQFNDHRIAMAAAVAAGICRDEVTVADAECTEKSYPDFWNDLETLEVC